MTLVPDGLRRVRDPRALRDDRGRGRFRHVLNVVYYRLTEPDQPILPEQDPRWQSVWHEYDAPGDGTTA